jgi:hypothetical protein
VPASLPKPSERSSLTPTRTYAAPESSASASDRPHAKGQDLQRGNPEWHDNFSTGRNTTEGFNGLIKDAGHEDLENGGRRRVRGYAMQTLLIA